MADVPASLAAHLGELTHSGGAMLVHGVGELLEVRDHLVGPAVDLTKGESRETVLDPPNILSASPPRAFSA